MKHFIFLKICSILINYVYVIKGDNNKLISKNGIIDKTKKMIKYPKQKNKGVESIMRNDIAVCVQNDMKYNLILTSNGFNNTSYRSQKIEKLFKDIAKDKKILLILNATKEGSNYNSREDVKNNFINIGAKTVDSIEVNKENVKKILEYDVVYAIGGDVACLLDDMHDSNFKKYLLIFLKKGIFIGESAGSIVLGENVKWYFDINRGTKPKYDKILKSWEGMNLTNYNVFPHINAKPHMIEKITTYEKEHNMKITQLEDGDFILVYIN